MKLVLAASAVVALVAGGVLLDQTLLRDPDEAFLTACEDALKRRLKAPSTYTRTGDPTVSVEAATPSEAVDARMPWRPGKDGGNYDLRNAQRDLYEETGVFRHRTTIEYDAENAYGTPLRGAARCEVYSSSDEPLTADDLRLMDVLIDGKTNLRWATEGLTGG